MSENEPGHFEKAKHVQRIGMPHFDIVDAHSFNKYHETALQNIRKLRNIHAPYLSPIDKFRLELDESWPAGANIESLYGKKCFVGLCRIINGISGSVLEPHIDKLSRDSNDSYAAHSLESQLAANIYIATPDVGGEVEIWLKEPEIEVYEKELEKTQSYHVNRDILGQPDAVISPKVGDLLIFNSRCFHAVRESSGGIRSSIAAFVGYRGINHSLSLWS
ncbi:2OG-Fe(II) oxygenase [Photobacterium leiognathi]|nr:2OG-Fe(II) oxygenase [Photobacterium leiognathi]